MRGFVTLASESFLFFFNIIVTDYEKKNVDLIRTETTYVLPLISGTIARNAENDPTELRDCSSNGISFLK